MKKNLLFPIIALLMVALSSCKDENENLKPEEPKQPSQTELLLTNHDWKEYEWIKTTATDTTYGYAVNRMNCEKDDFHRFTKDGNYIVDNGPSKCYNEQPQVLS